MAYTPIQGKFGIISFNGFDLFFKAWQFVVQGDSIDNTTFGQMADSLGVWWKQVLLGFCDGKGTLRGFYDSGNPLEGGVGLVPSGTSQSAYLGYSAVVGYTVTCMCMGFRAGVEVLQAGTFEADLQITNVGAYPG
jgi:hypothetical protein